MRVGSDFNVINNPCDNVSWGQYEDYTVIISDPNSAAKDEVITLNKLEVSPNPTSGLMKLSYIPKTNGSTMVQVKDILGKEVFKTAYDASSEINSTLDLSNLNAGVYMLSVLNGAEVIVKKIIIEE
jgi:hypothetical protein